MFISAALDYALLAGTIAALAGLWIAYFLREPKEYFPAGETENEIKTWLKDLPK